MTTLVRLAKRSPGSAIEVFQRQAHLSPGPQGARSPYDGLAITWFDDVAAMRAGAATEAYARTRADEANFLAGELPFVITTERTVFPRS